MSASGLLLPPPQPSQKFTSSATRMAVVEDPVDPAVVDLEDSVGVLPEDQDLEVDLPELMEPHKNLFFTE